jgi:hypothetical protein
MMREEQQATTPRALWLLVVLGPVLQRNLMLYAVTAVFLLLTIATGLVAVSIWRRTGAVWPTEAIDVANRIRFIAVLGLLSSAMSFLVMLAQGIATVHFDPCQL